jgi:D-alanine-D-alanine ligase-like ATP-grasp enzyme
MKSLSVVNLSLGAFLVLCTKTRAFQQRGLTLSSARPKPFLVSNLKVSTERFLFLQNEGSSILVDEIKTANGKIIIPKKTKTMSLCVLQSSPGGCVYEDNDPPSDVAQHLKRAGRANVLVENISLSPDTFPSVLVELSQRYQRGEIDCFVNLCDGAWDEPSCGDAVVDLLEHKLNVPFTGADLKFFEPTRLEMKKVALACGVQVPAWRFVYNDLELQAFLEEFNTTTIDGICSGEEDAGPPLRFPLIPKHFSSYSSIGLTKDSKVWNVQDLKIQCEKLLADFGGCLIEEFIEGREFTVLVAAVPSADNDNEIDVVAYEPVECTFGEGEEFKHYNLKWIDYESMSWGPVNDESLASRLKAMSRDVFRAIKGRGYGRLDIRSDMSGENLSFLEINPNAGIFYPQGFYGSADFILDRMDPIHGHADFLLNQVEVAKRIWRNSKNAVTTEARYDAKKKTWGLFALRDFSVGEVIQNNEEQAFHLVSKQVCHVML